MAGTAMVPIPKMDVLMGKFSNMQALIQHFAVNREGLNKGKKHLGSVLYGV